MKSNLAQALAYIDEDEGPEVNISPDEPGGSSCHGVTMDVLREYCASHSFSAPTIIDMKAMTSELAGTIFTWRFLDPLRFNELPSGVDYRMADAAITLGRTGACLALQMALAMWPVTGVMDDVTIAAIKAEDPKLVISVLDAAWIVWKHGMTSDGWAKYGHGWTERCSRVRDRTRAMIAANVN